MLSASAGGTEEKKLLEETQRARDREKNPDLEKGEKGTQRDKGTQVRSMEPNRPRIEGGIKSES